jgi:hypothetical protein
MRNILEIVHDLCLNDHISLCEAEKAYADSWKKRGGVGAFMMLARKWDRIENLTLKYAYDIFSTIEKHPEKTGVIDDIRDLRRYLLLIEAEMVRYGSIVPDYIYEKEDTDATTIVPAEE